MSMKLNPNNDGSWFETIWTIVDSHWTCIASSQTHDEKRGLVNYLLDFGFEVPGTIKYCIARNESYEMKFREYGAFIHIYIKPFN